MTDAAHSEKAHILVVDDDPRVRTMLSRYFEEEGFRVSLAESGTAMRKTHGEARQPTSFFWI